MTQVEPYLKREVSPAEATARLRAAGVNGDVHLVSPCRGGVTNFNHELTLRSGARVLLRSYPEGEVPGRQRLLTEVAVHELLRRNGLPVPGVLGVPAPPATFAVFEWIDGVRLRDAASRAKERRLEEAWSDSGRVLRVVHDEVPPPAPDDASFAAIGSFWALDRAKAQRERLTRSIQRLRSKGLISAAQRRRAELIADRFGDLIGERRARLTHGDAHAANILVGDRGARWVLAAWIDWERAGVGDPEEDLATFEVFTRAQVGATPDAFWSGYGVRPDPLRFRVYELSMVLFLASLDHAQALPPGRMAREFVATHLDDVLDGLT